MANDGGINNLGTAAAASRSNLNSTTADTTSLNVLLIGSQYDTSMAFPRHEKSRPFPGQGICLELERILQGGLATNPNLNGITSANVVFEERFQKHGGSKCFNLASWFHWPEPKGVQREVRWPNLRNEGPTQWDTIVLIGDPYTMEQVPGLYTHGVAEIRDEVAKTPANRKAAEVVLLMPWPNIVSEATVDHYKEVVYRTGRSGGLKVVPAGLAFEALGSPQDTSLYNYLAAAAIYSRLWGHAAGSTHVQSRLAQVVDATVAANRGAVQYTGRFQQTTPFGMRHVKDRTVCMQHAAGGTSSEQALAGASKRALFRTGAEFSNGRGPDKNKGIKKIYIGRNAGSTGNKSYKKVWNAEKNDNNNNNWMTFGYQYHMEGKANGEHQGMLNIFSYDMSMMRNLMTFHDNARFIPRRIMSGDGLRLYPDYKVQSDGSHMGPESTTMCGTYIYTMLSSRCPMDHQPEEDAVPKEKRLWDFQKIGYETAWHVGTLQLRAPGFKVQPKQLRVVAPELAVEIIVEFINKPQAEVTVNISITTPVDGVTLSQQKMIFTPENHNAVQIVAVESEANIPENTDVKIGFTTLSDDEVYNNLDDSWQLTFNHIPPPPRPDPKKKGQGQNMGQANKNKGQDQKKSEEEQKQKEGQGNNNKEEGELQCKSEGPGKSEEGGEPKQNKGGEGSKNKKDCNYALD